MTDRISDLLPQGSIPQVLAYMQHKPECRTQRPVCASCGTAAYHYGNHVGTKRHEYIADEACSCGLDPLLTALRSLASQQGAHDQKQDPRVDR
jgi:hypothetical protein